MPNPLPSPQSNFLLGYGEVLTQNVERPRSGAEKVPVYTPAQAEQRLRPQLKRTVADMDGLEAMACPGDHAVAVITLHPQFVAKSYFPGSLLAEVGLRAVGSRPARVRPERWSRQGAPVEMPTSNLFVAGKRRAFRDWSDRVNRWSPDSKASKELCSLEIVRAKGVEDRVKTISDADPEPVLELVLHTSPESDFVLPGFEAFTKQLEIKTWLDRRLQIGGLCFVPARVPSTQIPRLAQFSYLRVIRSMPKLRAFRPVRMAFAQPSWNVTLPSESAVNPAIQVTVFDGGLPSSSPLTKWITAVDPPGIGPSEPSFLTHGEQVSSALLFGPLFPGQQPPRPYAGARHHRVLDAGSNTDEDPLKLYEVLSRIRGVLRQERPEFINLALGPDLPVDDDDVHPWSAFFDNYLGEHDALAAIAVGNGGERDAESGYNRVQVPADCVNSLAVGASDSHQSPWRRASYSSTGRGRTPGGVVKPDVLAFGGCGDRPFWTASGTNAGSAVPTMGTSFAAPTALRLAVGVRAILGETLTPRALKALLIHCSHDPHSNVVEHGWGALPQTVEDLILCPSDTARVLYQGELLPSEYLRAPIPTPADGFRGMVHIRATFCYSSLVDPAHPANYTRSGLGITFRPHQGRVEAGAMHAKSAPFFQQHDYCGEDELTRDAHKWETARSRTVSKRASSLSNPVFDIHYVTRQGGAPTTSGAKIRYALLVSIHSPGTADVYNKIVRRYATLLRPLRPVINIPIRSV